MYRLRTYSVMYNFTLIPFEYMNIVDLLRWNTLTRIKTSIDNGIVRELHKDKYGSYDNAPKITISESTYPSVTDRMNKGFDASAVFGALYFFIPSLIVFSTISSLMMREKEYRLRLGLHVFGLSSASHWTAWNLTAMAFSAIPAIIFPIVGSWIGLGVFINSPYYLTFSLFFLSSYWMAMIGFIWVTFVADEKSGQVTSYAVILLSVLMLIIISNPLTIYFIFFNSSSKEWVKWVTQIFLSIPSFDFALIYGIVARITCNHFDGETVMQLT